ncbi:MAG: hypothetical protein K0S60_364 [Evtepia sp.]|jgi:hypothetical protein|nr:hypothetical protein [Evtepia sp.]
MKQQNVSIRQLMTLLFIALVAVGAEVVPGISGAGAAVWLAPLLALLPVLLLIFLAFRGPEKEQRTDLGEGFSKVLGKWGGRLAALIFLLWGLFLLVANTARCARRLTVAGGTPFLFSAIVLMLAIWMASKKLPSFVRACEIFYIILGACLVAIVLLAGFRLRPDYIFLFTKQELYHVPKVAASLLGVVSVGMYALFVANNITVRKGDAVRCYRWAIALFLTFSILLALILGTFGAPLTEVMQRPFFHMVAGLGVTGAFQRLEALISALWMLGDIALLGLLLFAVKRLAACVSGRRESFWVVLGAGLVALVGGELLAGQEGALKICQQSLMPMGSLVAGGILTLLFFLIKRAGKGGDSVASNQGSGEKIEKAKKEKKGIDNGG